MTHPKPLRTAVHHHLERCHQLLHPKPPSSPNSARLWEAWSVEGFDVHQDEVMQAIQQALWHLKHEPGLEGVRLADGCLLRLHFLLRDVAGSNAG